MFNRAPADNLSETCHRLVCNLLETCFKPDANFLIDAAEPTYFCNLFQFWHNCGRWRSYCS